MTDDIASPITDTDVEAELAKDVQAATPAPDHGVEIASIGGTPTVSPPSADYDTTPDGRMLIAAVRHQHPPTGDKIAAGILPTTDEIAEAYARMQAVAPGGPTLEQFAKAVETTVAMVPEGAPTLESFKKTVQGIVAAPPSSEGEPLTMAKIKATMEELKSLGAGPTEEEIETHYKDVVIPKANERMRELGYSDAKIAAIHDLEALVGKSAKAEVGEVPFSNATLALGLELHTLGANKAGRAISNLSDSAESTLAAMKLMHEHTGRLEARIGVISANALKSSEIIATLTTRLVAIENISINTDPDTQPDPAAKAS